MANNYTPSYNQYRTQTAGYALPSSVKTYSVFDPATGTWTRMTNGNPVQSVVPTQPRQQSRPRQVMKPLARSNARDVSAAINPQPIVVNGEESIGVNGSGITPSGVAFVNGTPVNSQETVIDPMFTPEFNQRAIDMSDGTTARAINNAKWYGDQFLRMAESMPTTAPLGTVAELPNFGRIGQNALNTARRIIPSLDDISAYANGLVERIPAGVRSAYDSVVDLGQGLFNRVGGFLQRPAPTVTTQTYTKVRPTHTMVNPNARRSANYYNH